MAVLCANCGAAIIPSCLWGTLAGVETTANTGDAEEKRQRKGRRGAIRLFVASKELHLTACAVASLTLMAMCDC